jgi:GT2 family glycosyltransferase
VGHKELFSKKLGSLLFIPSRHDMALITIEVHSPTGGFQKLEKTIEKSCKEYGLSLKLKSSLAKYPDSVHWHYKKGREPGTLEITFLKKEKRLWFSVQSKRKGPWIRSAISHLKAKFEGGVISP